MSTTAHGTIIVGSGTSGGTSGSFEITAPLTFDVVSDDNAYALMFDEWVSSLDGGPSSVTVSGTFNYQINGGAVAAGSWQELYDNFDSSYGSLSPKDGYITFSPISLSLGDTITILPGTWTASTSSQFNPEATGTFSGDMFLVNGSALSISAAVPEPSTWAAFAGVGALGFVMARRRRRA